MKGIWAVLMAWGVALFRWLVSKKPQVTDAAGPNEKTKTLRERIESGALWKKLKQ